MYVQFLLPIQANSHFIKKLKTSSKMNSFISFFIFTNSQRLENGSLFTPLHRKSKTDFIQLFHFDLLQQWRLKIYCISIFFCCQKWESEVVWHYCFFFFVSQQKMKTTCTLLQTLYQNIPTLFPPHILYYHIKTKESLRTIHGIFKQVHPTVPTENNIKTSMRKSSLRKEQC